MSGSPSNSTSASRRPWGWKAAGRWTLLLLVVAAVVWQLWAFWRRLDAVEVEISAAWLAAAVLVCAASWVPVITYWRGLLRRAGYHVRWIDAARAYYGGHVGKYIPGKAVGLALRAGMLAGRGTTMPVAAATTIYETLSYVSVGAALVGMLLPWIVDAEHLGAWAAWAPQSEGARLAFAGCLLLVSLVAFHFSPVVFTVVVDRTLRKRLAQLAHFEIPHVSWWITTRDFLQLASGWWIQGLCAGLTLAAVTEQPLDWSHWPVWTVAVTLGTVTGFYAMVVPAGLIVREAAIVWVLFPYVGQARAVYVAILLRGVHLANELIVMGLLYRLPPPRAIAESETATRQPRPPEGSERRALESLDKPPAA